MAVIPGPIVSAPWLDDHRVEVVVADVRWSLDDGPKRDAYRQGHIPGAVFVDLDRDLSDPPGAGGRHPLPSVDGFLGRADRLGLLERPVVCYDDQAGAVAARLWWMLQVLGYPAAVLDGGIQSWVGPLERSSGNATGTRWPSGADEALDEVSPGSTGATGRTWPADSVIAVDAVLGAIESGAVLLDARSRQRFEGSAPSIDRRPGHVPGSGSRPWTDNLDVDGRMKPPSKLAVELSRLGIDRKPWLASCGSGVTGCHHLLAAAVAGLPPGRLFAGSWSQWSYDDERPVETGPGTAVESDD